MSPRFEEFLVFGVMSILVLLFTWIHFRRPQGKTGLWMLGWLSIFIHFAAPLLAQAFPFPHELVVWIKVATLEIAGACFLLSVSPAVRKNRRKAASVLVFVTFFSVLYLTGLLLHTSHHWIYPTLLIFSIATFLVHGAAEYGHRSPYLYLMALAVISYGGLAILSTVKDQPWIGLDFYLSMAFGLTGIAYWFYYRKVTPGVVFTSLSFVAWGLVWPTAAIVGTAGPDSSSFFWDLPKYFVAFGMIMTLFEIQAEAVLHSAEEYQELFENNLAAVYLATVEGQLLDCNNAFLKMDGFSCKEEALATPAESWYATPDERHGVLSRLETSGVLLDYESLQRKRSGTLFWILERATLRIQRNRKLVQGTLIDITERKRAELALRESEERFATIFRQSPIACAIVSLEGVFLDLNETLATMLRRRVDEVIGKTGLELGLWQSQKQRDEFANKLRVEGMVPGINMEFRDAEGEIHSGLYFATMIRIGERDCILGMQLDQTEQRKLEARYRQAQKMESLGRLAGGIAHDFNNMLGVIGGFAELLAARKPHDAVSVRYCTRINDATKRASGLTRQLLTFSRREISRPSVLKPANAIGDLAGILPRLIGEDIELSMSLRADGTVIIDPTHFEQIIFNLMVNARDAMPDGGRLFIEMQDVSRPLVGSRAGLLDYVAIKIRDTGTGMDEATRTHAFEPFFTTKNPGSGTGLGLATVYGIIQQCSGEITIESEVGKGTEIIILLPAAPHKEPARVRTSPPEPENGAGHILLVEDEPELREATADFLRSIGYSVQCAANGVEALEQARQEGPIDLVISDVVMPKMNGREMSEKLREFRPEVPVMFVSGYADDVVLRAGISSQGTPFLQKPFPLKHLALKVEELLRQKEPETAAAAR
jgi:two-component system cell cycle sensor histidine kinase/response regulator CckA